ncbi:MAG: alpha/beta hydrolase [Acidimicrobiales bacterium]
MPVHSSDDPIFREPGNYDEFGMLSENADEIGIPFDRSPQVRRVFVEVDPGRRLSAIVWGDSAPELVLLHGGAQNAHTWDTVALILKRPLVAIDLPGHGHSDGGRDGSRSLDDMAEDTAKAIAELAPDAAGVVGMSMGGLTSIVLADKHPELMRSHVLVDVTPGVNAAKSRAVTDFINGPETFASFDDILSRTIEHNPGRSAQSLRRGVLHNAVRTDDGTWVWRWARHRAPFGGETQVPDFAALWDALGRETAPLMLVRGMRSAVVDDADEAELRRRRPDARIEHVENAGHSIQGDAPRELAQLLTSFVS